MTISKRPRRVLACLATAGLALVSLSGCLKVDLNATVRSDDTVDGHLTAAVRTEAIDALGHRQTDAFVNQLTEQVPGAERTVAYRAGGFVGKTVYFSDVPLKDFGTRNASQTGASTLRIRHVDNRYVLRGEWDLPSAADAAPKLDESIVEKSAFTVRITFPGHVTGHNGKLDGDTVSWKLALGTDNRLFAESDEGASVKLALIVGAICVGLMLLVMLLLFIKLRIHSVGFSRLPTADNAAIFCRVLTRTPLPLRVLLCLFLTAATVLILPSPASADPATSLSDVGGLIDKIVPKQLSDGGIPGAIVTVVADGKTVFAKGYGKADVDSGRRMDARTTGFHTASEAKLYTATAVLQLVGEGKLDLDADVNRYLRSFKVPDAFGEPVTVRDLLTFTSGFDYDVYGWSQWDAAHQPSLASFAKDQLPQRVRAPGEYIAYNNYDYVLAGYLVELASGQSYGDYVHRHVFAPLGMDHTSAARHHPSGLDSTLATGYRPVDRGQVATRGQLSPVAPAGGDTITSSSDMAAFMKAQLSDDPRLGAGVAKQLRRQQFTSDKRMPGMGFGFEQRPRDGQKVAFKDGDLPGIHHDLALLPDAGIGIHVVYNGDGEDSAAFWDGKHLINSVIDHYFTRSGKDAATGIGGDVSKYAGSYEAARTTRSNFARVATLMAPVTVSATGSGRLRTTGLSEDPNVSTQDWIQVDPGYFVEIGGDHTLSFDSSEALISSDQPSSAFFKRDGLDSPTLHLWTLALTALVLLVALAWIPIQALIRRLRHRDRHPLGARAARLLAWVTSLGVAGYLTGFAMVNADSNKLMQDFLTGNWLLSLTLNTATFIGAFAIALVVTAVVAWARGWWTVSGRVGYSVWALAAAGFMWIVLTYNLIGVPVTLTV
ncbi:MAG TPA: serine hydrolase domain-containing protein [Stackebrandtia sp.]|uniref:serine hydrolase domain-containing protein n=1 Tax=Stackebrandtia sp. TaxID=2023065 RepID=UPI002D59078F|nr:serine hydrolase domain-containing protein [Stackebrandtia sp.]HZE41246.1 serine hydrolase domain-containing protein [Stackebrandtia sp.]